MTPQRPTPRWPRIRETGMIDAPGLPPLRFRPAQ